MNKKILFVLVSVLSLSAMLFTSCKKEETLDWIKLNKVYFTPSSTFLEVGETADVAFIALYTDASEVTLNDSVTITCSDPSIVKYEKGKVTALKDGKVTLTASYAGMNGTCEITSSTLKELKVTVDGVSKDLLAVPGEVFEAGDIKVEAVYTAGGSKVITDYQLADVSGLVIPDPTGAKGFSVEKIENYTTTLLASFYGVNGDLVMGDLDIHIGALDSVKVYTDATKFDKKGKEVYKIDTLLLGSTVNIYADGFFSWKNFQAKDTIPVNYLIDSYTFEHGVMDINKEKHELTTVQVTPDSLQVVFDVNMFNKKTYESRSMDIVKDTTYTKPTYAVTVFADYVYYGDYLKYTFTEKYENKVEIDLTNTGNPNIMSTATIDKAYSYNFNISTGKTYAGYNEGDNGDSVFVMVVYDKGAVKDTTSSKKIRIYNRPSLSITGYNDSGLGKFVYYPNLCINGMKAHLYKDEVKIVDNFGKDWTSAIKMVHDDPYQKNPAESDKFDHWVLPIDKSMVGLSMTLTYGPEKRTTVCDIKEYLFK